MAADPGGGTPPITFGSRFQVLTVDEESNGTIGWKTAKKQRNGKRTAQRNDLHEQQFVKQLKTGGCDNGGRFLVVTRTDPECTMDDLNPFVIKKCIDNITSGVQISRSKEGTLLLKTLDRYQAEKLLKQTKLCESVSVKITEHSTMNRSKGTIFCPDLNKLDDTEILEYLKEAHVTEVKRMQRKNSKGKLEDTGSFILTFNLSYLPQTIEVGFYSCRIKLYVPNPMKCTCCLRFGHRKDQCKGNQVCASCGLLFHNGTPCSRPLTCINCNGSHHALSKQCPKFIDELEIQRIRVTERIPMKEARQKRRLQVPQAVFGFSPSSRPTFAHVVQSSVDPITTPTPSQQPQQQRAYERKINNPPSSPTRSLELPETSSSHQNSSLVCTPDVDGTTEARTLTEMMPKPLLPQATMTKTDTTDDRNKSRKPMNVPIMHATVQLQLVPEYLRKTLYAPSKPTCGGHGKTSGVQINHS
ncbi:uncharacterized protein LOC129760118 [Uranotaenia lowii]|uniref:uncharacterized protein LOC129760118 n=1 Tax=Uranotaenia lowii TaxID=190385 RepID=UPI00247ABC5F|nr:uncharacterized protein LOC129760118 [Uranotaenia lowii]